MRYHEHSHGVLPGYFRFDFFGYESSLSLAAGKQSFLGQGAQCFPYSNLRDVEKFDQFVLGIKS